MASSGKQTVLITGVNGFIGYASTVKALREGYKVRAAVRREEAREFVKIRGDFVRPFEESGDLQWIILPDISDKHAFAKAAQGCSFIIHIAFPLGNTPGNLHEVAMDGLGALLHAAEQNRSVTRIVWTSSTGGITCFEDLFHDSPRNRALLARDSKADKLAPLTAETQIPIPLNVDETGPSFLWYQYGKIAATNALREYSANSSFDRPFDIVIIFPGWTLGPNELCRTRHEALDGKGTNSFLLFLYQEFNYNPIIGKPFEDEPWIPAAFVHIDDVAEGHVNALKVSIPDNGLRSFLLCSDGPTGPQVDSAISIVRENFPKEAQRLYTNATYKTIPMKMDCEKTETDLLGHSMKSYETAVKDTVAWYSDLSQVDQK